MKLYQLPGCPYCLRVRRALDQKNVKYEVVDVASDRSDSVRQMLLVRSGVATVPVLEVDDVMIGESQRILAFIDAHL